MHLASQRTCTFYLTWLILVSLILFAATSSSIGRSFGWLVHKNSPLFDGHTFRPWRLKFGMEVKCVCVCVCVCVWRCFFVFLTVGWKGCGNGSGLMQNVSNFQMVSQTCTRFSGKISHEPKDSRLTVWANWQKGAWQWEWPVTKNWNGIM